MANNIGHSHERRIDPAKAARHRGTEESAGMVSLAS